MSVNIVYQSFSGNHGLHYSFGLPKGKKANENSLHTVSDACIPHKENAYFTVEVSLLFPIITGVVLLLVYMLFFQYNRCLLEFDVGGLAIKGVSDQETPEHVKVVWEQAEANIYEEKYLAWEMKDIDVKVTGNSICVSGSGRLCCPFTLLIMNEEKEYWETSVSYKSNRLDPVGFIRTYRKVIGGE